MSVQVVKHPLIQHKLGLMRQHDITTKDFRDLASELANLLTYEATKDLITEMPDNQGAISGSCPRGYFKGRRRPSRC